MVGRGKYEDYFFGKHLSVAEHFKFSPARVAFRDAVLALGCGWALVRTLDDALGALAGGQDAARD